MQYAIIENNIIDNIAESEEALAENWEPLPEGAGRGWRRSGPGQPFVAPMSEVSEPIFPQFVGNQKLDLFTLDEQLAVVTATMSDPMVKLMYDRLLGAAYLTYEDPETEQGLSLLVAKGLSLLVAKGLISAERKAAIVEAMLPA